jgi:hypothetical protein
MGTALGGFLKGFIEALRIPWHILYFVLFGKCSLKRKGVEQTLGS